MSMDPNDSLEDIEEEEQEELQAKVIQEDNQDNQQGVADTPEIAVEDIPAEVTDEVNEEDYGDLPTPSD